MTVLYNTKGTAVCWPSPSPPPARWCWQSPTSQASGPKLIPVVEWNKLRFGQFLWTLILHILKSCNISNIGMPLMSLGTTFFGFQAGVTFVTVVWHCLPRPAALRCARVLRCLARWWYPEEQTAIQTHNKGLGDKSQLVIWLAWLRSSFFLRGHTLTTCIYARDCRRVQEFSEDRGIGSSRTAAASSARMVQLLPCRRLKSSKSTRRW